MIRTTIHNPSARMKTRHLLSGSLALMAFLASCTVETDSPDKVQAASPPYQPHAERVHVARLERKGIVPRDLPAGKDVCSLHAMKMEVITVPECDADIKLSRAYIVASPKYFPNGRFPCPPEHFSQTGLHKTRICPKCVVAERAWRAAMKAGKIRKEP